MSETRAVYIAQYGVPLTGLHPAFSSLKKLSDGTTITFPTITEVGGGWYKFTSVVPINERWVGTIDAGVSVDVHARYIPVMLGFSDTDIPVEVFVTPVYDEDSDSLTFCVYMNAKGKIHTDVDSVAVALMDMTHSEIFSLTGTSSANGVFVLVKGSPTLTVGEGYYIKASIVCGDETFDSVETMFTLK